MELTDDNKVLIHVTEVGGCPLKAILKAKKQNPTNVYYDAKLGTAIHQVCEEALKQVMESKVADIPKAMQTVYEKHYKDTDMFYTTAYHDIQAKTQKLVGWIQQEIEDHNFKDLKAVEKTWSLPLDKTIGGMPVVLTGTADIVFGNEIVDLKSGKTRSKNHALQIGGYSHLMSILDKEPVVRARIVYLGADFKTKLQKNGVTHRYHERDLEYKEITEYRNEWLALLEEYVDTLDGHWPNEPDPEPCSSCYFCQYHTWCYGEDSKGADEWQG